METRRNDRSDAQTDPLADFRRKAENYRRDLAPEDMFPLVHLPDRAAAISALRELGGAWPRVPCFPLIPFGSWADAVRALIEGGVRRLIDLSRGDQDLMRLACSALGATGSLEAAHETFVNLALGGLIELEALGADRVRLMAALEEILFARGADVEPGVASRVRELLHAHTRAAASEDELFLATDVIRYVGDETSIALLESYVPPSSAHVDEEEWRRWHRKLLADVRRRVRKRRT
ncbi:MAG: hypothetical protein KIT58_19520 [Planctomycetota bacterium]|nr:hypothetical protein [Planctomycetota bacterium]